MKKTNKTIAEEITCDVIQVFRSDPADQNNRKELRVVKWSGGETRVLEKRRVWNLKDGTLRCRQLVGLSASDVEFIVQNQDQIMQALKGV